MLIKTIYNYESSDVVCIATAAYQGIHHTIPYQATTNKSSSILQ